MSDTAVTSRSDVWTPTRRAAFGAVLALTMATSTFSITAFSVLSRWLLDGFDLARWQLGALVTAIAVVGAVTSPVIGRLSDTVGGRRAVQLTFGLSAVVLAAIALSPVYAALLGAALVGGVAQAIANPATNKLIAVHAPAGRRGTITGIKQSGVQVGVLLGGSLLPLGATTFGWRPTLLVAAVVPVVGLLATGAVVPEADGKGGRDSADVAWSPVRSPFLLQLAVYGFLVGAGWSAVFTYLPDYAQNALGWSATAAGLTVSVAGLFGVMGRIGWSAVAERRLGSPWTLATLAGIGTVAVAGALFAPTVPALLWVMAALFGASSGAWNAVGMFAIVSELPSRASGAASGVVMFGFLVGLGIGPPPFGWSVDVTGSYAPGLVGSVLVHAAAFVVAAMLSRAPVTAAGRVAP